MMDAFFLLIVLAFFAGCVWLVHACDRL